MNKWLDLSLGATVFLSGLYGGIGFFTVLGGNPAVAKLSPGTFAEYWQHIDSYMGARMPFFGPLLLLSVLVSVILLLQEWSSPAFWFMLLALLILVGDMVFVFSVNHPLNQLIQSWDLDHLPANVQEVQLKVVRAFNIRCLFMTGAFVFALLSVWFRKPVLHEQLVFLTL